MRGVNIKLEINDIEEIRYRGATIDIILDINFEGDKRNRWELIDPQAMVEYSIQGNGQISGIELIDNGLRVHGHHFSEEEIDLIESYLKEEDIVNKAKKYFS